MKTARRSAGFARWLGRLRDQVAVAKISARIDRLCLGNPGDVKPVGEGVSEMRIDHGPGYRVYFAEHRSEVIFILAGGTKTSQASDIVKAQQLFRKWKNA